MIAIPEYSSIYAIVDMIAIPEYSSIYAIVDMIAIPEYISIYALMYVVSLPECSMGIFALRRNYLVWYSYKIKFRT